MTPNWPSSVYLSGDDKVWRLTENGTWVEVPPRPRCTDEDCTCSCHRGAA